jgi:hypothetical protein
MNQSKQDHPSEEEVADPSNNGSGKGSSDGAGSASDGRIPDELRQWVYEQFPEEDVLRSLDELNEQECLELSQFLDLAELDRAVASEQAQRQR